MSYKKMVDLIQLLAKKTADKSIVWEETANEEAYLVSFPNYSVMIDTDYNSSLGSNDIRISILDGNGRIIDSTTDEDVKDQMENSYNLMKNMYDTARRQVLGVEDALDNIIDELRKDDLF